MKKLVVMFMMAVALHGQTKEPQGLKPEDENVLLKLQVSHKDLERAYALIQLQMQVLSEKWAVEESRLREKYKLPAACKLLPERKWNCEDPPPAAKKN